MRDVTYLLAGAPEEVLEDAASGGGDHTHHAGADDGAVDTELGGGDGARDRGHGGARDLGDTQIDALRFLLRLLTAPGADFLHLRGLAHLPPRFRPSRSPCTTKRQLGESNGSASGGFVKQATSRRRRTTKASTNSRSL
nr:hypothetical protein [Streptomyces albidoflavus]